MWGKAIFTVLVIVLLWEAGLQAQPSPYFDVTMNRGQPYVSLMSVASAFGVGWQVLPDERAMRLRYSGQDISITDGTVLMVNQQLVVLSVAPYWRSGELFVPLDAIQKIFYVTVHWRIHSRQVAFTPAQRAVPEEVPPR